LSRRDLLEQIINRPENYKINSVKNRKHSLELVKHRSQARNSKLPDDPSRELFEKVVLRAVLDLFFSGQETIVGSKTFVGEMVL